MIKILLLCLCLFKTFGAEEIGDPCTAKGSNQSGKCRLVQDCPAAITAIRSSGLSNLHICGYRGTFAIICCADSPPVTMTAINATVAINSALPVPSGRRLGNTMSLVVGKGRTEKPASMKVGDRSKSKCKEYGRYVYSFPVAGGPAVDECVLSSIDLIIGGEKAKPKEFPHMALIGFDGMHNKIEWLCGGSLISEKFVLTAGHCLYDDETQSEAKYIRLGDLDLGTDKDDAEPQDFAVAERIPHPEYNPFSNYHDIALLRMNASAKLNPYVRPACLATDLGLDLARNPVAAGWGFTSNTTMTSSEVLLKVKLEYFSAAECNVTYASNIGRRLKSGIREETQICAGSKSESKDTCQGDSGGPLQLVHLDVHCMHTVIGITSFGKICGVPGIPAVYTKVSHYVEWIEGIVWSQ